jgi:hypothetical protein
MKTNNKHQKDELIYEKMGRGVRIRIKKGQTE